ncbi:MAG: MBL fold metallo-hydrolase [Deinococcales bacterium]
MLLKQFYDQGLAQASFMLGCQAKAVAIVIDPRRDIDVYIEEAKRQQLEIVAVTETHIHADYLSGARELAAATGAKLYLSDEGGSDWAYAFEHEPLVHGSEIALGNIRIKALHTPGHTPESLSFLVTDGATTDQPGFLFTGDFVFVGDIGRPDLLDEAAGGIDTRFIGAKQMFSSLRDQFLTLPDYVQVHPGHGAGSACGKALGAIASSTVGYERRFAWWAHYLEQNDLEGFTAALLEGQPDAPTYFGRMKRQNKAGPALLGKRDPVVQLEHATAANKIKAGALLLDTRARTDFQSGAVAGSLHLPAGQNFLTWASWFIDPEENQDLILLARDQAHAVQLRDELARVGIDRVVGFVTSLQGFVLEPQLPYSFEQAARLSNPFVLDVRAKSEFASGHLPEATQLHTGRLYSNLHDIPKDRPVLLHCQSGARSAAAASYLRSRGFRNIYELEGGYAAWQKQQTAVRNA